MSKFECQINAKFLNVKLPAHRAGPFDKAHGPEQVEGLPGKAYHFTLCPFLPAGRQGPRLSRFGGTGHVPVKYAPIGLWNLDFI
jgi:hypothetical protein